MWLYLKEHSWIWEWKMSQKDLQMVQLHSSVSLISLTNQTPGSWRGAWSRSSLITWCVYELHLTFCILLLEWIQQRWENHEYSPSAALFSSSFVSDRHGVEMQWELQTGRCTDRLLYLVLCLWGHSGQLWSLLQQISRLSPFRGSRGLKSLSSNFRTNHFHLTEGTGALLYRHV